jgi:signal transduction histidine kinase
LDENGVIKGIAGDYLDEISKLLNIKFEWVGNQSWAEAIMLAKKGEVDLLSAVVRTVDREEYLDFTDNYLTIANMIFARTGSGIYENLDSLAGLSISAEAGDVNVENLKLNHPDITVIEVKSALEAIKLTSIGAADAYVGGLPTTSFYMAEEAITNITAVGETPYISKLGMGVPKGNEILVSILNKAIRSIPPLRKSEIVSNWYSLKIENKPNYTLIINLSIMGSLLLAFILYWNNRLRKEVQYRKKAEEKLVIAQQKTEEESAAKSSFLANMSHEIRTPLNAIVGFSDAMIQGIGGEVIIKKHKEYLKDIKSSGEHLATVIKDILDLSKIEAGKWKLDKSTFNFNDSIIESIKMLEVNISDKQANIHFNNDKNITFTGDQHAVKRIIINLLSNSIKFIGNDGNISINVEVLIKEKLILTIEDDGI